MFAPSPNDSDVDMSWRLFLLYVFLFLTSAIGTVLCTVLVFLLRTYDVFHVNFRTILWNVLTCILVNNFVQMLRPLLLFGQYLFGDQKKRTGAFDAADCLDLNSLPSVFCIFLSVSGILLAIERLYATLNYAKYEYENFTQILDRIFFGMWLAFVFTAFYNLIDFQFSDFDYLECTLTQIDKDPIKTHWHILFAAVFQAVCLLIFSIVVTVNREKQTIYIKHYYNSLSPRFQIGENIKATRLLVSFTLLLFFSLDFLLIHRYLQHSYFAKRNVSWESAMFWQEVGLLVMPLFSVIMPLVFILKSAVFLTKARMLVKDVLASRLLGRHQKRGHLNNNNNYVDFLHDYWQDTIHLS